MTIEAALYTYFNSFGWAAYPETEVPAQKPLPRITYQVITDSFDGAAVYPTVRMWAKGSDAATLNAKVRALADDIGPGGKLLTCDDGYIRIMRATPWCRNVADGADDTIKGRYINIALQYLTI